MKTGHVMATKNLGSKSRGGLRSRRREKIEGERGLEKVKPPQSSEHHSEDCYNNRKQSAISSFSFI